jgi:hypothetical protein
VSFTEADRDHYLAALRDATVADNPLPEGVLEAIRAKLDEAVDYPPVPALLPRDWPRQLDELCDDLSAPLTARQAAFALVDRWVLAAADASTPDTA